MGLDGILRILLLSACIFSVVYSLYHMRRHKMPLFFKCAFYSCVSQLLCTLLYFVVNADPDWDHYFSLGDFGCVTSAFFVIVAIKKYIPKEYEEQDKKRSALGILVAAGVAAAYIVTIVLRREAETIFGSVVSGVPLSLCAYYCVKTIENKYKNPFAHGVKMFCILHLCMLIITALDSAAFCLGNEIFYNIFLLSSSVVAPAIIVTEMYFLKKGLEPWSI